MKINIILKFNILEEIMSREIIAEDHTIDGKESSKIISKKSKLKKKLQTIEDIISVN